MRMLPLGAARALGSGLGRVFYACVPYERRKTLETLRRAYPGSDLAWRKETAAAVFGHLGRSAAEFFRLSAPESAGPDAWVAEVEGFEHLERPVREGRGVVAVTAHFGHWELLAAWVARRLPTAVVARQAYDPRLDAVLTARRERNKITVFGRNTSVRPILRWLNEGKVLGVLADQDTGVDSLYVEFFGLPSKTPSGPAVLAQATGSDLVCGFCFRRPDGRYRLVFSPAIPVPPRAGGGALELWGVVQEYTRRTEAAIREAPGLWAWNHARWRSDSAKASTGWDPRLAAGCLERIAARRAAAGRAPQA
ncbi:MAG TPA: lysophospholipid acyltransferase family protein [bacterium]|nr:lysophospholipid acyltransferase family protein [bacterium]